MKISKYYLLFLCTFFLLQNRSSAEEESAGTPVVKLHYYNSNNSMQYLILESMMKKEKVLTPQKNKTYAVYLDSSSAGNMIGKMVTDESGKAKAFLPLALKTAWDATPTHTFIVKEGDEEIITDYIITKAKITIDTVITDDVRNITVSVMKMEKNKWVPASDVEMKVGIERLGSILSAGDEETYTTDSSGMVTVELKKNNLPGDLKGNYVLAARAEDNDQFGNLLAEKTVAWGKAQKADNSFFEQRALWATRFKAPYWLLILANSIMIGVWGTLAYLVFQLIKIIKLGA